MLRTVFNTSPEDAKAADMHARLRRTGLLRTCVPPRLGSNLSPLKALIHTRELRHHFTRAILLLQEISIYLLHFLTMYYRDNGTRSCRGDNRGEINGHRKYRNTLNQRTMVSFCCCFYPRCTAVHVLSDLIKITFDSVLSK